MVAVIGIAVVAGAGFLLWLFMRGRVHPEPTSGDSRTSALNDISKPGSAASVLANGTLGIGAATFKYGLKGAELVADGALSLGKDAVDASARVFSRTAILGGTVVTDASKVSSVIVSTGGKVVSAGVNLPVQVVKVQVDAVKSVISGAASVTKDLGSGAASVGKKVIGSIASIF